MQNCVLNARGVGAKKPKSDLGIRKNVSNAFWRKEVTWMERNGAGRAVLWPAHPHGLSSLCQVVQKQGVPFRPREGDWQGREILPWERVRSVWPLYGPREGAAWSCQGLGTGQGGQW